MSELVGIKHRWRLPDGDAAAGTPLDRLLRSRHITPEATRAFLSPAGSDLARATTCPGASAAAAALLQAGAEGLPIQVWGDYDADGLCSCAILGHAIREFRPGADLSLHIPTRSNGYGLSVPEVERVLGAHGQRAGLLVTADCGATAHEPIARARAMGWRCVVIDHHALERGSTRDLAEAFVHWDIDGASGEQRLATPACAALLCWKVACCMAVQARGADPGEAARRFINDLMPFAALGTIADVMPLRGENRVITMLGLRRMAGSQFPFLPRFHAHAEEVAQRRHVDSITVAFTLAPLLNAPGRMGAARPALDLLLMRSAEADADASRRLDEGLEALIVDNNERKAVQQEMEAAATVLARDALVGREGPIGLCLHGEGWKHGVGGVVAARVAERFGCPTFILCLDSEARIWRGSARSAGRIDIARAIEACREIILTGGGHPDAGGVTVAFDRIQEFAEAFGAAAAAQLALAPPPAPHLLDGEIAFGELQRAEAEQLARAGPFGRGFPSPRFVCRGVRIAGVREQKGNSLGLTLESSEARGHFRRGHSVRAVCWQAEPLRDELFAGARCDLVLSPSPGRDQYVDITVEDVIVSHPA